MTSEIFLFLNIGTSEMMLILLVALFFFGGKKLPELARGLGRGIREFKDASETIKRDISDQINNFESDLEVKDQPKAIAQNSVDNSGSSSVATDEDGVEDISHSDQYYQNYDYNFPGETTDNSVSNNNTNNTAAENPESTIEPENTTQTDNSTKPDNTKNA